MRYKKNFLTIFLMLILAALACNAGNSTPLIPADLPPIPTLANLSDKFEDEWQKSLAEAVATGNFTVTITESQITDFINRKNAENPDANVSDIRLYLRDGQIQIIGQANNDSGASTTLQIVTSVIVVEEKLQVNITSAQLGVFPVPAQLLDSISISINDALNGQNTADSEKLQFENIVIVDGLMTITGKIE
jgi:hypothetical protein